MYYCKLDPGKIIIDNFCGGGGASKGIKMAFNRDPDIAINHDPAAIVVHKANHPNCVHLCQDLNKVDPVKVVDGKQVALAWFSPDCTHHSKARGKKPKEKNIRDLAWRIVDWALAVKPDVIAMENVEEWLTWGPIDNEGQAIKELAGETFDEWYAAMQAAGYSLEFRIFPAFELGAATIRKRLYLFARSDGKPIGWPSKTHDNPKNINEGNTAIKPWLNAAHDVVDWTLPCPSIFLTKNQATQLRKDTGINCKRPLADNTMARIARGLKRYVIDSPKPFIVSFYGTKGGKDLRTPNIEEPLRTQTTENRFGVVVPFSIECANSKWTKGGRSINNPLQTITVKPDGGSISLVSAFIAKHYGGATGTSAETPFPTITQVGTQNQVVAAHVTKFKGKSTGSDCKDPLRTIESKSTDGVVAASIIKMRGDNTGHAADEPVHTISAGGNHLAAMQAFLMTYYGNSKGGLNVEDPCHTVTVKDRIGIVMVEGIEHQIVDIGMRMLTPREMYRAQGFPENYIIDPIFNGKPLTKKQQVANCGNSVCPPVANALLRANFELEEILQAAE